MMHPVSAQGRRHAHAPLDRRVMAACARAFASPSFTVRRSPSPRSAQRGFTLIEVLVVVVIVAVLVAALTLAVGGTSARQLDNAGERFQALLDQACHQAQLDGREIGVVIAGDGYTFDRLDGDQWRAFGNDGELRPRRWPDGLRLTLNRDGEPLALATPKHQRPQLVCFSSGELTPFSLLLALGDAPGYRVTGADDGSLTIDHVAVPQ